MENCGTVRERMVSLVAEWEQSKLSQKAFCTQHQIAYHKFHYWYKRYRGHHSPEKPESPTFVPLSVESDAAHTEVVLAGGARIIFHQPVSASFLIQLTE